ncbi:MAG TPA: hypothetical protein VGR67_15020 [Candidatus Polarisedimenticolia bacterium]|nr:hypothetical protein [Candidatus Polarisedimenticolia bacterium]
MSDSGRALARDLAWLGVAFLLAGAPFRPLRILAGFALALFFPGYSLLRCLRTPADPRSPSDLLHCGAASLGLCPLALRLAGTLVRFQRWSVLAVLVLLPAVLLVVGTYRPRPSAPRRSTPPPRAFYALLLITLLLLVPTLTLSSHPDGSETRVKGWDLNNHLSIAEAIASRGLPPINPFLQSGSPFYYHTFFHILLGAILLCGGAGAPSYLCIALLAILLCAIFLETLFRTVADLTGRIRVAWLACFFVSVAGGFDVLPVVGLARLREEAGGWAAIFLRHWNVDGWVSNRGLLIPTFFAGYYWVPHAVAALVVLLLALRFLRKTETGLGAIAVAGACLASMAGYNGYIALAGAAAIALLRGVDLVRFAISRSTFGRDVLLRSALAGAAAVILGWPVLSLYAGERGDVDKFRWAGAGPLAPLQILLEFGPALLLGAAGMERARRDPALRPGTLPFLLMVGVSLPVLCLVASTGENNDLAMRVSMLSWIGLAVFGGMALDWIFPPRGRGRRGPQWAALGVLGAGCLSVAWFAAGASIAKPVLPADEVAAGRWIRTHLPPGRTVQGSPLRTSPDLVYLSGHPSVLSDTWAGHLFYSDREDFSLQMEALMKAFSAADPAVSCQILESRGVAALIEGPPERQAFPRLAASLPWPCLARSYSGGDYRIYTFR